MSLAIALSVPPSIEGIGELTGRDIVAFVTGGVILVSLLVQGTLLPAIVRWARLPQDETCLLYTSPSPRDVEESRMPSSA